MHSACSSIMNDLARSCIKYKVREGKEEMKKERKRERGKGKERMNNKKAMMHVWGEGKIDKTREVI